MTLMFTQGHTVIGKLELVQLSVVKLHEATQMFVIVDCVRGMPVKSCKYGEYGWFEHLLFLFIKIMFYVLVTSL